MLHTYDTCLQADVIPLLHLLIALQHTGEYGELYYFTVEELSEIKNFPIAKFASNNRTDIDMMWMNLKCRIASSKKRVSNLYIVLFIRLVCSCCACCAYLFDKSYKYCTSNCPFNYFCICCCFSQHIESLVGI